MMRTHFDDRDFCYTVEVGNTRKISVLGGSGGKRSQYVDSDILDCSLRGE